MAYSNTAYSNQGKYLETEVFSADPVKLVCMLYRGAIEATGAARRYLKDRQIRERSREIMRPLRDLYAYMRTRLLEANARQIDPPLAEVEQLLSTLLEGWKTVVPAAPPVAADGYEPMSCTY